MFTGIIEEVGRVLSLEHRATGARLAVSCSAILQDAALGASIAVNGACLTAVELARDSFSADLAPETLAKTNLGDLAAGSPVNLERPLRASSRLDGHFVLGHVDGTADVVSLSLLGEDNWWFRIRLPGALSRYVVSKGSLAVDGISLTVAEIERDIAAFTIIPHTFEHTALRARHPGSRVNIEVDILAKHLEKLVSAAKL
ncbi:MAG: riboflavin synthase [Acidobacteriaceae bacterium]|nr:riboflavin synthase [Acidobacteriaceae bacterium]MBV8572828.1 riboflavin synthase [Acidobacteriaceae bacterium]